MRAKRTGAEWEEVCRAGVWTGYQPGGKAGRRYLYRRGVAIVRDRLKPWAIWRPGDAVLDLGCGNGQVAMGLLDEGLGGYWGLDVCAGAIAFCRAAFAPWPEFRFRHLDVRNARYAPQGAMEPAAMRLPFEAGTFDAALCKSLFSHLETEAVARRYVGELARVIRPGGRLYSTWFVSPPNEVTASPARTVYRRAFVEELLAGAGFRAIASGGGYTTGKNDQWALLAERAGAAEPGGERGLEVEPDSA